MAFKIEPSSFECDCGHLSEFGENTVRGMEEESRKRRKGQVLLDSEANEHGIVFCDGVAVSIICPEMGERAITDDLRIRSRTGPAVHDSKPSLSATKFTPTQGRYLAFIDHYTKLQGIAPAEADMQAYFRTSAPSVHSMVVTLERHHLIARTPGQARSIKILVPPGSIPDLKTGAATTLSNRFPHITEWLKIPGCSITLGYDPGTTACARAFDTGGLVWSGGKRTDSLDETLASLDAGIASLPPQTNTAPVRGRIS